MRRWCWLVAGLGLTMMLSGCSGTDTERPDEQATLQAATESPASADLPEPVRKAVAIAREIEADPDDFEAILERHKLTADEFENLLYEISLDPELSKAYDSALK